MSMKIKNLNLNSLIEYENNLRDNDAAVDAVDKKTDPIVRNTRTALK